MRHPGVALGTREEPFFPLLETVAAQLKVPVESWSEYGQRAEIRREHALELQALFGFKAFTMRHDREGVRSLASIAAWVTPCSLSHSAISRRSWVNVENIRTCRRLLA